MRFQVALYSILLLLAPITVKACFELRAEPESGTGLFRIDLEDTASYDGDTIQCGPDDDHQQSGTGEQWRWNWPCSTSLFASPTDVVLYLHGLQTDKAVTASLTNKEGGPSSTPIQPITRIPPATYVAESQWYTAASAGFCTATSA